MTTECVRVGDVLRLERRPVQVDPMQEYELVGIYSWGKGLFRREPKPGAELGNFRFFALKRGDLVLSNIQAWEGAIGVAREPDAAAIGTHRFLTYVPVDARIDTTWAKWFFLSEPGMTLIRKASPGTTMRNRTLAVDRFEALQIPLPPIDEQRRVAARLDHVESACGEVRAKGDCATSLATAFTASTVLRLDMALSEKRAEGWARVALGEVLAERVDGVPVEAGGTYRLAGVYSFGRGMFERADLDGSATSYRILHRLHAGQVVLSRLKGWEGAISVVPDDYDGYFLSPEFPTFDIDAAKADAGYLGALVMTEHFWSGLAGASRGIGARRERVHADRLLEQEIDLPPLEMQVHLARIITSVSAIAETRSETTARVDALLPAALNEAFASIS